VRTVYIRELVLQQVYYNMIESKGARAHMDDMTDGWTNERVDDRGAQTAPPPPMAYPHITPGRRFQRFHPRVKTPNLTKTFTV
jgi:hypothetical protein